MTLYAKQVVFIYVYRSTVALCPREEHGEALCQGLVKVS